MTINRRLPPLDTSVGTSHGGHRETDSPRTIAGSQDTSPSTVSAESPPHHTPQGSRETSPTISRSPSDTDSAWEDIPEDDERERGQGSHMTARTASTSARRGHEAVCSARLRITCPDTHQGREDQERNCGTASPEFGDGDRSYDMQGTKQLEGGRYEEIKQARRTVLRTRYDSHGGILREEIFTHALRGRESSVVGAPSNDSARVEMSLAAFGSQAYELRETEQAQREVETHREVERAQREVERTQREAEWGQREVERGQREVERAQREVERAQREVEREQRELDRERREAQREADRDLEESRGTTAMSHFHSLSRR